MSRSVHSVKLNPYHSSQLSSLSYTLGDVVFDQDNLTLRVMDGNSYGGNILANQTWTQGYINQVFSQAVVTFGNTTNYSGVGQGTYAVKISGGLLVAKDTNITGALTVNGTTTFNSTVNATLSTAAQPNITSVGTLQGLTSSSTVTITDSTAATALGTGSLITSGGASIAKDLYVGGKLVITGNELVLANPTFNGTTTISGSSTPSTVLFTINNGAATPVTKFQVDSATGNTTVAGDTTVAGNLTVTGLITGQGTGVAVGSTAPSSPVLGSLWYNSINGNLYVYYTDTNGSRWIQPAANNQQAGYVLPNATSSQLGGVIVPLVGTSGINSVNGTISLATASTTQLGGVKVDGTTITINNGIIKASAYTLPIASTSVLGGVKIDGTTITVNASGQLQHTIPTASTSILGGVTFDGTTILTNIYGQLTIPPVTIGSSRLFPGSTITSFTGITGIDGAGTVNIFNSATTVNAFIAATSISMGNANSSLSLLGNFNHSGAIHTIAPTVSGTMDNVVIGSQTPAAATFTSITVAGETITGFTDIYDFDDVSYYVDGFTNNFPLTFNQSAVTLTSPFILTVAIDGAIQPAFDLGYDLVWLSGILPASKGYTIDLNGNLQFAECPSMGSQIQIRSAVSVSPTPHTKKVYPFKALDIMMGF